MLISRSLVASQRLCRPVAAARPAAARIAAEAASPGRARFRASASPGSVSTFRRPSAPSRPLSRRSLRPPARLRATRPAKRNRAPSLASNRPPRVPIEPIHRAQQATNEPARRVGGTSFSAPKRSGCRAALTRRPPAVIGPRSPKHLPPRSPLAGLPPRGKLGPRLDGVTCRAHRLPSALVPEPGEPPLGLVPVAVINHRCRLAAAGCDADGVQRQEPTSRCSPPRRRVQHRPLLVAALHGGGQRRHAGGQVDTAQTGAGGEASGFHSPTHPRCRSHVAAAPLKGGTAADCGRLRQVPRFAAVCRSRDFLTAASLLAATQAIVLPR